MVLDHLLHLFRWRDVRIRDVGLFVSKSDAAVSTIIVIDRYMQGTAAREPLHVSSVPLLRFVSNMLLRLRLLSLALGAIIFEDIRLVGEAYSFVYTICGR